MSIHVISIRTLHKVCNMVRLSGPTISLGIMSDLVCFAIGYETFCLLWSSYCLVTIRQIWEEGSDE
jgi:hypothetical protein